MDLIPTWTIGSFFDRVRAEWNSCSNLFHILVCPIFRYPHCFWSICKSYNIGTVELTCLLPANFLNIHFVLTSFYNSVRHVFSQVSFQARQSSCMMSLPFEIPDVSGARVSPMDYAHIHSHFVSKLTHQYPVNDIFLNERAPALCWWSFKSFLKCHMFRCPQLHSYLVESSLFLACAIMDPELVWYCTKGALQSFVGPVQLGDASVQNFTWFR